MTHTARRPTSLSVRRLLPALALLLLAPAAPVAAECIPVRVPDVISRPGSYCVTADFEGPMSPGASAIEIQADHVVLDFQGHVVRNTAGPKVSGAIGVRAWDRSHVVVKNGTLAGFWEGVSLGQAFSGPTTSTNHLVEGMRIYDCQRIGIGIGGVGSVVRDNVIWDIHGIDVEADVSGIYLAGGSHRVIGNEITKVGGMHDNVWGIRLLQGVDSMVIGNRLVATWNGVWMNGTGSVYRDNLVGQLPGGATHFSGGIDAGGNVAY